MYYCAQQKCSDVSCGIHTRQISIRSSCINNVCRGTLKPIVNEKDVCNTFSYFYTLFDPQGKYINDEGKDSKVESERRDQKMLCEYIDHLRKENSYDKVELAPIFKFMDNYI